MGLAAGGHDTRCSARRPASHPRRRRPRPGDAHSYRARSEHPGGQGSQRHWLVPIPPASDRPSAAGATTSATRAGSLMMASSTRNTPSAKRFTPQFGGGRQRKAGSCRSHLHPSRSPDGAPRSARSTRCVLLSRSDTRSAGALARQVVASGIEGRQRGKPSAFSPSTTG